MRDSSEDKRSVVPRPHGLTMDNRQKCVITGVEDVDSFNEQMVVLVTSAGAMTLYGDELHISRLNLEDGQLLVEGQIAALEYDDRARGGKKLGKLFK